MRGVYDKIRLCLLVNRIYNRVVSNRSNDRYLIQMEVLKMVTYSEEYKMKMRKLAVLFEEGMLPDTEFINSFVPRVVSKMKSAVLQLTVKERQVIDKLFDQN